MSLFLLLSFPLYLCAIVCVMTGPKAKFVRIVRCCWLGILAYIPAYIFSRIIPDPDFFPWDIYQVFWAQLLNSREAYFRIVSSVILLFIVLRRYYQSASNLKRIQRETPKFPNPKVSSPKFPSQKFQWVTVHSNELFCWFTGYFLAANFHDFILLGPFPNAKELFFQPLSRLLFAQFSVLAFELLQLVRHPQVAIRRLARNGAMLHFLSAFVLLSIFSSAAIILNAYWGLSVILLILLLLYFSYAYYFGTVSLKYPKHQL